MELYRISAITLFVRNMDISCKFYSRIPGFRLVCGGSFDSFTTYEVGKDTKVYLNLELVNDDRSKDFGRIIFHTDDVDELYTHMKNDNYISKLGSIENEPTDASWGERFFHIRDPDHYQLSFATPISKNYLQTDYTDEDFFKRKKRRYKSVYKRRYREKK
ncbi:MAG: VOC family protein [Nitrosopumilaceae archaeon]